MGSISDLLAALWFFLPAGLANAAPVFANKLPVLKNLNAPMDFGKSWGGMRLFGDNKTWRGLLTGIAVGILVIALQKYLFNNYNWAAELSWFDYRPSIIWLLDPLMSGGALLADAIESYFKRRRRIPPGDPWFPFDQTDYIIGGCILSLPVIQLSISQYFWVLFVWLGIHLLTVYIGYKLDIRYKPI